MTAVLDVIETLETKGSAPARPRSGGPRTPEGKARSRRNALKTGLRAKVVLPEDLAIVVAQRTTEFVAEFQPRTPYEKRLVRDMALASAQYERCAERSIMDAARIANRAEFYWDEDRMVAVEDVGARLRNDPSRVVARLRSTTHGADWLIRRWEILRDDLRSTGVWDDDQRRLAFDLLGVPRECRTGFHTVPRGDDLEALEALVLEQIDRLRDKQVEILDDLDESERLLMMGGLPIYEDATTARLRKYENGFRREYYRVRDELFRVRQGGPPLLRLPEIEPATPIVGPIVQEHVLINDVTPEAAVAVVESDEPVGSVESTQAEPEAEPSLPRVTVATPQLEPRPGNRRARRKREKLERQAARRAAVAARKR